VERGIRISQEAAVHLHSLDRLNAINDALKKKRHFGKSLETFVRVFHWLARIVLTLLSGIALGFA